MQQKTHTGSDLSGRERHETELDVVVPFTTPELTRAAIEAANRMGAGLKGALRLIKVQVVPYPLDLSQSPVPIGFLKKQLCQFQPEIPISGEIRLARDLQQGLLGTLTADSVVVLAARRRPWKTSNERLAESLRRAGHKVLLVSSPSAKPPAAKPKKAEPAAAGTNREEAKECSTFSIVR